MSPLLIQPDGPLNARICIVGQNPGKTEINEYVLKPFQGYSGNLLKKWWSMLTPPLRREDIYVDNLIPYLCIPEKLNEEELRYWEEELHKRLARLTEVNVIVPVGNHACYALIGKGKVAGANRKDSVGITSLRGSIYEYRNKYSGRTCKVIPTLHPSALFKRDNSGKMGVTKGILEKRVFRDWQRIQYESTFNEINEPKRTYVISPYEADVARYTQDIEEQGTEIALAVDIETPFGKIDCIGFSHEPSTALVIPTFTQKERDTFNPYINRLLSSNSMKVFQNGHFDTYWLRNYGFTISNWLWDLMYMHVVIHPTDNHSLDFLSSMYLPFHRYWKDHAKEDNGEGAYVWTESKENLLTYNGMDACISRELLNYIYEDMSKHGLVDYYLNNIQPLFMPALDVALTGVRVNETRQVELKEASIKRSTLIREQLKQLAGEDLIAKTGFSPLKLQKFVHETLKLPKKYKLTKKVDGKSKSVSLDATVLAQLAYRYQSFKETAQLIVDYRAEQKKQESWLDPNKQDEDGYVRAQFSPTTEAGRFASKRHPMGRGVKVKKVKGAPRVKKGEWIHFSADEILEQNLTENKKRKCKCKPKLDGWDVYILNDIQPAPKVINKGYNLQNTKKEIREIYVPDRGCLFLEIDQCLTGDTLIETTLGGKPIKDIRVGDYVLSSHDRVVHWGEVTAQKCMGVKEICTVVIDSGEGVTCSLSHKFLVIRHQGNGRGKWKGVPNHFIEEVEAQNLKAGDRLVPLRKMIDRHTGYEWLYSRSSFERTPTHELVAEAHLGLCPKGKMVHHKDEDKLNNHPANLEYLTSKEHNGHHNTLARVDEEKRLKALQASMKTRDLRGVKNGRHRNHVKLGNDLNHKVKEVLFEHRKEEVYSITVEPEHNYALSIGVFVKNSQVEDRMCKMYTGAARMVELANRHPSEFDVHTHNAVLVFGVASGQVDKRQRFLGKIVSHGAERGMTGKKLSDKLLAEYDMLVSPTECQGMIDKFLEENWEIRDIFFPWVRQEIITKGYLINSWGQKWNCAAETLDEDLYRRGYSFPMQCCDEQTEVLTTEGFIPFAEVSTEHKVAQWNQTGKIVFKAPKQVISYSYQGMMCNFDSVRVSACVTPNHRMPYIKRSKEIGINYAENLVSKNYPSLPVSGEYSGEGEYDELTIDIIQFLVALQADGYFKGQRIEWHFTKMRKVNRLVDLLTRLGVKYNKYYAKCNNSYYIATKQAPFKALIEKFLPKKVFSWRILDWRMEQKITFIEELRYWDGSQSRLEYSSFWYDSTIKQNSDVVQAVAVTTGYRAYQIEQPIRQKHHSPLYRIYVHKTTQASISNSSTSTYKGKVYCLETATGFFLVRRNGKVHVTGNSEAARMMFSWGLVPVHRYLVNNYSRLHSRINIPRHDALIMSVPFDNLYEVSMFTLANLERPREIFGNVLTVPCSIKVGLNDAYDEKKGEGIEFKRMPSRDDFMDQVRGALHL